MQDDKKALKPEEPSAEKPPITTSDTTPINNPADQNAEDQSDWVAVGSGLGIDE